MPGRAPSKTPREYVNARYGAGGLAQIMRMKEAAGDLVTRTDVLTEIAAYVLGDPQRVRQIEHRLRAIQAERSEKRDAKTERTRP